LSRRLHPVSSNIKRKDEIIEVFPIDKSKVERKWRYARNSVESILPLLKVVETKDGEIQIVKARDFQHIKTVWDNSLYIAGDHGTRL
jgi:adenine-specific DNA-methyltransferase